MLIVAIIILLPFFYYFIYLIQRTPLRPNFLIAAHRGGAALAPENTMAAFRNAVDAGVEWLEMDLQMSKDGYLVVIHDETVDRTTNGTGRVRDLTFSELRKLDAGQGQQIPTFNEALAFAKSADAGLLAELKSPHLYPGIEAKVVQALIEADYLPKSIVISFDAKALEKTGGIDPRIKLGAIYGLWQLRLRTPEPGGVKMAGLMGEMVLLNPWLIKKAQNRGEQALVWFGKLENPFTMRLIRTFGADGLIVNDPVTLQKVLGYAKKERSGEVFQTDPIQTKL